MTKAIIILLGVVGSIVLWILKNKFSKQGRILNLKKEIDEMEEKDNELRKKQVAALAAGNSIDVIYIQRGRLSREIADLRNKLRKEGVDY